MCPRLLDLNEVVDNLLKMLRRLVGEDVELVWKPGPAVGPVKIDPAQVEQVLAHLCVNAREAMPRGGQITIGTGTASFDPGTTGLPAGVEAGEYAVLTVADTGRGMDRATLDRLFEPFFTTREPGMAGGLGLAAIYGIIRQNQGGITVSSEPGKGTTFSIYLRRHQGPVGHPLQATAEVPTGHGETVLVVDDDPGIRSLTRTMLARLGYDVLVADSAAHAVRLGEEHRNRIRLLIADIVMPGESGPAMAARLRSLMPGLRCLFMSGYTGTVLADRGGLPEGAGLLPKPFSLKTLADQVRGILGG